MLYLLKKKLNDRVFIFVAMILFILLYAFLALFWAYMADSKMESYYYFLSQTSLVAASTFLILDILITALVLLLRGYTPDELLNKMSSLMFIAGFGVFSLFLKPYDTSLYFKLIQDIPNVISNDTYTVTTSDFYVTTEKKRYHTRNNSHIDFLNYAIFDGYKGRLTDSQYHDYITFLSEVEYREMSEIPFEAEDEYTITYLPHSKCIIEIEFPEIKDKE